MPTKTSSLAEPKPVSAWPIDLGSRASLGHPGLKAASGNSDGSKSAWKFYPVWGVLAFAVLSVAARFGLQWGIPFPQCWMRKLIGVPCPSCGCTRSLAAWGDLNLAQAFYFNPLFFCVCVALIVWLLVSTTERLSGRPFLPNLRAKLRQWPVWRVAIALVAVNWLYLYLKLPK